MLSRREFSRLALATSAASTLTAKIDSTVGGVLIGVQTYSFRDRSLEDAIAAMRQIGLGYVELWSGHVEPRDLKRDDLRKWRLSTPMDHFRNVRNAFNDAGITLYAYNYSFRDDFSDEEIARGFEMAKALGVKYLTASSNVSTAKRVDPHAARAKITVGMHNHSNLKPNEFARPEDFAEAMKGMARYIAVNLDIGHFVAAGFDPVDYIAKNHARIVTLHLKDLRKNQGENVPFGEGDTPIKEVLQLLRKMKLKIPANIEYEYKGADTFIEVTRCFDFCRKALA